MCIRVDPRNPWLRIVAVRNEVARGGRLKTSRLTLYLSGGGDAVDAALTTSLAQVALNAGAAVSYAGTLGSKASITHWMGQAFVIVGRCDRRQKPVMKYWATVMVILFAGPAERLVAAETGWQSLFNARDLTGWEANADAGAFTIVDGAIRAHATHPTNRGHLFFVGGRKDGEEKFRNFELVAVVRGEPNSNSGIFFHTDRTTRDGVLHLRNGYEVQLNSSQREKRKTGSLYAVVDLETSPVDESQWFTVRILVEGKRVQVWINDTRTVDYTEPENPMRRPERAGRLLRSEGGAIALQAHDDNSTFYFREIRIRRL